MPTTEQTGGRPQVLLDPKILEELRWARADVELLDGLMRPTELWETLRLAHANRATAQDEFVRSAPTGASDRAGEVVRALMESLEAVRRQDGAWVGKLRECLKGVPGAPGDAQTLELAVALITISPRAREAVDLWISVPVQGLWEAADVVPRVVKIAQAYEKALEDEPVVPRRAAEAARPSPRPAPAEPTLVTKILPRGVRSEILEDVRRVAQCREIFKELGREIEIWNWTCLVMAEGNEVREAVDRLLKLKKGGPEGPFVECMAMVSGRLAEIRARDERLARELRAFLAELPVGRYALETSELVLGFILASPAGRQRAQQWLGDPARYRQEAATRFEGLVGRAMNYQRALRADP